MDINCPYCNAEQNINHEDGYGYAEDVKHSQECKNCKKTFIYVPFVVFYYDVEKADCLNGSEHSYEATTTYPKKLTQMECVVCGETRTPTEKEMFEILSVETKKPSRRK